MERLGYKQQGTIFKGFDMIKTAMVLIILHGYKDAPYTEKFIGKVPDCRNATLEPLTKKLKKSTQKKCGDICYR